MFKHVDEVMISSIFATLFFYFLKSGLSKVCMKQVLKFMYMGMVVKNSVYLVYVYIYAYI